MRGFGDWWAARDAVALDVARDPAGMLTVTLQAPTAIEGLTLAVPATPQADMNAIRACARLLREKRNVHEVDAALATPLSSRAAER